MLRNLHYSDVAFLLVVRMSAVVKAALMNLKKFVHKMQGSLLAYSSQLLRAPTSDRKMRLSRFLFLLQSCVASKLILGVSTFAPLHIAFCLTSMHE